MNEKLKEKSMKANCSFVPYTRNHLMVYPEIILPTPPSIVKRLTVNIMNRLLIIRNYLAVENSRLLSGDAAARPKDAEPARNIKDSPGSAGGASLLYQKISRKQNRLW